MPEKFTQLFIPKGEWSESLLMAFQLAELSLFKEDLRSSTWSFVNQALPIVFEDCRSKEMWDFIQDPDTEAKGGFLGTDVAVEQSISGYDRDFQRDMNWRLGITDRDDLDGQSAVSSRSWRVPLMDGKNPLRINPAVYLGTTPRLREGLMQAGEQRIASLSDLRDTTIYTEYPNITATVLSNGNRPNAIPAKIKPVQGGSEYKWKVNPSNGAVVTIRSTDTTMNANKIERMFDILSANLVYVEGDMSEQDRLRVDDLKERLVLASRRMS